jgi:type 1 glutamine amidotransferase
VRALIVSLLLVVSTGCTDPNAPIRVLFIVGSPTYHDIVTLPPILEARLSQEGQFAVTRLEPPPGNPVDAKHLEHLANLSTDNYDVVLFYVNLESLAPDQEAGLERFLAAGGGLVALHGSSWSFADSELWDNAIGGRFIDHAEGKYSLKISLVDSMHPITAGLSDFETTDEEYCHALNPNVERNVLGRFDARPEGSLCPDGPNEMMWTRELGGGRIFYTSLGHDHDTWQNPSWQRLVVQAIQWAANED